MNITSLGKLLYGSYHKNELKKYIVLGSLLAIIGYVFSFLVRFKDPLIRDMTSPGVVGTFAVFGFIAKIIGSLAIFISYGYIIKRYKPLCVMRVLSVFYAVIIVLYVLLMLTRSSDIYNDYVLLDYVFNVMAWIFASVVDSLWVLYATLIWAFASQFADDASARKGFSLIVLGSQFGLLTYHATAYILPHGSTLSNSFFIFVLPGLILSMIPIVSYLNRLYEPRDKMYNHIIRSSHESFSSDIFCGLKSQSRRMYVVSIAFMIGCFSYIEAFLYRYIERVIRVVHKHHFDTVTTYMVNIPRVIPFVIALFVICGSSVIIRKKGVEWVLKCVPLIIASIIPLFFVMPPFYMAILFIVIQVLFYACALPVFMQLFIPVIQNVRYISHAWIQILIPLFVANYGKKMSDMASGKLLQLYNPVSEVMSEQHVETGSFWIIAALMGFCLLLCGLWYVCACYSGKKYSDAIREQKVVSEL
jgi:hypothetical protein